MLVKTMVAATADISKRETKPHGVALHRLGTITGVARPKCPRCERRMQFIGKESGHPLFGSIWKWRCTGAAGDRHKASEIRTDYRGNRVKLPRIRNWGWQILPFERKRLSNLSAKATPGERMAALERCSKCDSILHADRRGRNRWRMSCTNRCLEPFFVNQKGEKCEPTQRAKPRVGLPRKARKCPVCRKRLTLSRRRKPRESIKALGENIIPLVCVENGKSRHRNATFYFDLDSNKFLRREQVRVGQRPRELPFPRPRCCRREMHATRVPASAREPEHYFFWCATLTCTKGRGGKKRNLKLDLDGKRLRWLRPPTRRINGTHEQRKT